MPETDFNTAIGAAERIRIALKARRIEPITAPATASFGVVELRPGETGSEMLGRVDRALYRAKHAGRNCVVADAPDATMLATR